MLRYFYIVYHGHVSQKEAGPKLLPVIGEGQKSNETLEKIEEFASFYGFDDQSDGEFKVWARENDFEVLLENEERISDSREDNCT